ncbi:MAG: antitoxin family protein [Chloroflexota bacterium]|nr:antitoxin family protein [Chloroflexota bacterium]
METFTVQAIYEKGVLRPRKKLNLPEHSVVEVRVKAPRVVKKEMPFASLMGAWEHLPAKDNAALERSLLRTRKRSARKVKKLAKALK